MLYDTNSKKVTFLILMANKNNAWYIEVAFKSVISQSYPNWELIIVDDNLSDNSIGIIKPFLSDMRIKLIRHYQNNGYGVVLKTGTANASNEVFGILDAVYYYLA